ncbi:unnamed protein product [Gongylonema pulchrum]|uniref:Secreted protein n=1 Tax=Gongylonema pulchrum TaxID=637853 RepID=A0A183DEG3_9BILA|nr:unnamed protein product [Gongylonema pulchrum]
MISSSRILWLSKAATQISKSSFHLAGLALLAGSLRVSPVHRQPATILSKVLSILSRNTISTG